ncbi:hypothetical protein J4731_22485 [Providencia rettgeri]|nr:hypothetical protein [Providencia rettgeri]
MLSNSHEKAQNLMKTNQITHITIPTATCKTRLRWRCWLLKPLKTLMTKDAKVAIDTLFKNKDRTGNRPFHDWMSEADFQNFADQWFAASMGKATDITVFNYCEIFHIIVNWW